MDSRAIFFDRDDTLMKNVPYLGDPTQVEVFPQARSCLEALRGLGFELFVISNQSGVGRGLITLPQVDGVNAEMIRQLGGNFFRKFYMCYEEPGQPRIYQRKPSPNLVYEAAREFGINLANSFFIGDRLSDILAGRNAGCRTVLVLSGHNIIERPLASHFADFVVRDLNEAEDAIRKQESLEIPS